MVGIAAVATASVAGGTAIGAAPPEAPQKPQLPPAPASGAPQDPLGPYLSGFATPGRTARSAVAVAVVPDAERRAAAQASGAVPITDLRGITPDPSTVDRLARQAEESGTVRAIVQLRVRYAPLGRSTDADFEGQRSTIRAAQARVVTAGGDGVTVLHEYGGNLPVMAVTATPAALRRLAASDAVAAIHEDQAVPPALDVSVPLIGAADAQDRGFGGAGWTVAVLDTGVETNHPFLAGATVDEACYSGSGHCPNGRTTQTGTGSGVPCTYAAQACRHGTHVAGIAVGLTYAGIPTPMNGVANLAGVISIQVFSRFSGQACNESGENPCALSYPSDQLAGLNRVFELRETHNIAAVNISIGGGAFTAHCDSDPLKSAIDNLLGVDIATVISSGNDGWSNAVASPGCISTAITVGATDDADNVWSSSNAAPMVDLLAPGVGIRSSVPGGAFGFMNGTSMASPHVAGAIAVMKARSPLLTPTWAEFWLKTTGKPVNDAGVPGGLVKPRVQVLKAIFESSPRLLDDVERSYRNPIPNAHDFESETTGPFWSAVGIAPPAGADFDLRVADVFDGSGTLAVSDGSGSAIDFVVQDSNRRALDWTFPTVTRHSGSGRYTIEYANPRKTIGDGVTSVPFGANDVLKIWDSFQPSGLTTCYRVVPASFVIPPGVVVGQNLDAFLFQSDPANAGTWVQPRAGAVASSALAAGGGDESFCHSSPAAQWLGLVVTRVSFGGTATLYRDTSAPTGTMTIGAGDPTTTNTRTNILQITGADPETGVRDMRVAADGALDTEPWEAFAPTRTVTLPAGDGLKVVTVQLRNNAGNVSHLHDLIFLDEGPDLVVSTLTKPPAAVSPGRAFSVTDTTRNSGSQDATAASVTRYVLSADTVRSADDVVLTGTHAVPALGAARQHRATVRVVVPATAAPGTYRLLACADDTALLTETNETNNCRASATQVTVRSR
jgi:subtilisin